MYVFLSHHFLEKLFSLLDVSDIFLAKDTYFQYIKKFVYEPFNIFISFYSIKRNF